MSLCQASILKLRSLQPVTANISVENRSPDTAPLLSGKAAARIINVVPQTLAQWRVNRRVEIPFVRVGRRIMYRMCDLNNFINANTHGAVNNLLNGGRL